MSILQEDLILFLVLLSAVLAFDNFIFVVDYFFKTGFSPLRSFFFSFLYITICSTMHFFLQLFFAYNNFLPVELSLSSVSLLYFVSILSISKLL